MGGFQTSGVNSSCLPAGIINSEILMTGSSSTTVTYALSSNPGVGCTGTMKFPDIRQFDERVYQADTSSSCGMNCYISPSGSDSNPGTSSQPWLTPNHAYTCGNTITAQAGTYLASSFASGNWGAVSCPANNNVAWVKCATFDACKVNSGSGGGGILITSSYWGVQGFEISNSGNGGPGFGATPATSSAGIHHIIFANNLPRQNLRGDRCKKR